VPISEIQCPACRAVDWSRDGYRIRLLEDGSLESGRVSAAADGVAPWICEACGYRVVRWGVVHARLNGARLAGEEQP